MGMAVLASFASFANLPVLQVAVPDIVATHDYLGDLPRGGVLQGSVRTRSEFLRTLRERHRGAAPQRRALRSSKPW
jgi:hypothetical protein